MQLIIISGQIGSGKTTISQLFHDKGYVLIDSDSLAKKIIKENKIIKNKIHEIFNNHSSNLIELSISSIKNIICESKTNKDIINNIIHPIFYNTLNKILESHKKEKVVVEIPLIETLSNIKNSFITVVVDADQDVRMRRYLDKKNDELEFFTRMTEYQKSRDFYINNADHIITNNDTIDKLKERFNNLYKTLNDE